MDNRLNMLFQAGRPFHDRIEETTMTRSVVIGYVKQLFKRADFPQEIFVALGFATQVNKGDVVFASHDCEHPHDFIPLPRIDDLITNLPTKEEFLSRLGVDKMEDVTPWAEDLFWNEYEFQFCETADGVKVIWE
ncbi:MAG: hypothetical protein JXB42_01620 [Deltaproteobacteria bacterium]|nr:hypothetical protein [Deltaproteobacteria bacterium]